jgi:hypothetical protein
MEVHPGACCILDADGVDPLVSLTQMNSDALFVSSAPSSLY